MRELSFRAFIFLIHTFNLFIFLPFRNVYFSVKKPRSTPLINISMLSDWLPILPPTILLFIKKLRFKIKNSGEIFFLKMPGIWRQKQVFWCGWSAGVERRDEIFYVDLLWDKKTTLYGKYYLSPSSKGENWVSLLMSKSLFFQVRKVATGKAISGERILLPIMTS